MKKIKRILILAMIFMFLLLAVANVSAAQYNINNKNSSESISDLLDFDINDGDTLFLEDGVYEDFSISVSKSINIKANPGKVHLKGSALDYGIEVTANYVNISNIQLSNYYVGISLSGSYFYLENIISNYNSDCGIIISWDEGTSIFKNVVTSYNGGSGVEITGFNRINIYNLTSNNNGDTGLRISYGGICNIYDSRFNNNYDTGIDISDYDNLDVYNSEAIGNTYSSIFSMEGNFDLFNSDFKELVKDGELVDEVVDVAPVKPVTNPTFVSVPFIIKKNGYLYKLYTISNIGNVKGSKSFNIKIPKGYALMGYSVNTRAIAIYSGLSRIIKININNLPVYKNKSANLALISVVLVKDGKKEFSPLKFKLQKSYKKLSNGKFKVKGLGIVKYKAYKKGNKNIRIQFFFDGKSFRTVSLTKDKSKIISVTKNVGGSTTKQSIATNTKLTSYYSIYISMLKKGFGKI